MSGPYRPTLDKQSPGSDPESLSSIAFEPYTGSSNDSRDALRADLGGRVEYDIDIMSAFLRVGDVPADIVDRCYAKIIDSEDYGSFYRLLGQAAQNKRITEQVMYLPLRNIFDIIEREGADEDTLRRARRCTRKILITKSRSLDDERQGFPALLPDMSVVDVDPSHALVDSTSNMFRRQSVSFMEIKLHDREDPAPRSQKGKIKTLTAQAADYAGLHFASRPFQIFVLGFVVFGKFFRTVLFTRGNVYYSGKYNILEPPGLEMLIRAVRSVTWQLSDRDMGLDPAVRLADGHTFYGPEYPKFVVGMTAGFIPRDHPASRQMTTDGPSLWSSLSWLGRGTSVWKCTDGKILKVAWRNEKRMSESEIYDLVGARRGVARLEDGGDVLMMGPGYNTAVKLDTNFIIAPLSRTTEFNTVLHRVFLDGIGKPLWQYSTIEELARGLLAALAGHRRLSEIGVLHRDVSPGNVYLWDSAANLRAPSMGEEGFIADLELASVPHPQTMLVPVPTPLGVAVKPTHGGPYLIPVPSNAPQPQTPLAATSQRSVFESRPAPPKSVAGPSFTGTAQFVAKEILDCYLQGTQVARDVHHDLESFLLVIIYSLYRRFTKLHPQDEALRKEYEKLFGHVSLDAISDARSRLSRADPLPRLMLVVANEALRYIIPVLCTLIHLQNLSGGAVIRRDDVHIQKRRKPPVVPPRQLITYDEVDAFIRELLSPSQEE